MLLPAGIPAALVKVGPYPGPDGPLSGYVTLLPLTDVVHTPTATTIPALPITVPLGSVQPVLLTLLASDATGLTADSGEALGSGGLRYGVDGWTRDRQGHRRNLRARVLTFPATAAGKAWDLDTRELVDVGVIVAGIGLVTESGALIATESGAALLLDD